MHGCQVLVVVMSVVAATYQAQALSYSFGSCSLLTGGIITNSCGQIKQGASIGACVLVRPELQGVKRPCPDARPAGKKHLYYW